MKTAWIAGIVAHYPEQSRLKQQRIQHRSNAVEKMACFLQIMRKSRYFRDCVTPFTFSRRIPLSKITSHVMTLYKRTLPAEASPFSHQYSQQSLPERHYMQERDQIRKAVDQ